MRRYILLFGICLFLADLFVLRAQQNVTGRITDSETKEPVFMTSVYIANTTIGTTTDENGTYHLVVPTRGSFEVVVSHVSYQAAFYKVDQPKSSHKVDFILDTRELPEVVVAAQKTYSQRDVDLFWLRLLGVKPSRRGMEVLNPEKVHFYLTKDKILNVSCQEPIEILNHATGYRIRYILGNFQHNYKTNETLIIGKSVFEELTPQNTRQVKKWEQKRKEVYAVSLICFFRALYTGETNEKGFLLQENENFHPGKVVFPKSILQTDEDTTRMKINSSVLLFCLSRPVTDQLIEQSDLIMWSKNYSHPIMIFLPQRIIIYPDGTYTGTLYMDEFRGSLNGLSNMLPIEYGLFQPT